MWCFQLHLWPCEVQKSVLLMMMVPDQLLRSYLRQHRATLTIVLLLVSTSVTSCVVFFEKGEVKFTFAPIKSNITLLDLMNGNNGTNEQFAGWIPSVYTFCWPCGRFVNVVIVQMNFIKFYFAIKYLTNEIAFKFNLFTSTSSLTSSSPCSSPTFPHSEFTPGMWGAGWGGQKIDNFLDLPPLEQLLSLWF